MKADVTIGIFCGSMARRGGVDNVAISLVHLFEQLGYKSTLLPFEPLSPSVIPLLSPAVAARVLSFERARTGRRVIDLIRYSVVTPSSVIISIWPQSSVLALLCKFIARLFRRNIKVIISEHCDYSEPSRVMRLITHFVYPFADERWALTRAAAIGAMRDATVVPNFLVSKEEFNFKRRKNFVCIGHLNSNKRQADLLAATVLIAPLLRAHAWRVLIVGLGPDEAVLRATVERSKIADLVDLTGYHSNVSDILDQSAVLVSCSTYEAFPLVILEALRAGCFVISSAYGDAIHEILTNEVAGEIYPVGNVAALATAMARTIDHSAHEGHKKNWQYFERRYSREAVAPRWELILQRLEVLK